VQLPPLETESVGLGAFVTPAEVLDTIGAQAGRFYLRLRRRYNGDAEDIAQAAYAAFIRWLADKGEPDRIRELEAFAVIHKAMVAEIRGNKRQDGCGDWTQAVGREQLTPKQVELLSYASNCMAKIARRPHWEILYLVKACGWTPEEVVRYFRTRKKTDKGNGKRRLTAEGVRKSVEASMKRIRKRLDPTVVDDVIRLSQIQWFEGGGGE
jgi:hypothetical protein